MCHFACLRHLHEKLSFNIKIWKEKEEDYCFYGSNSIAAVDVVGSFAHHQTGMFPSPQPSG
jgi:hypothetical protein